MKISLGLSFQVVRACGPPEAIKIIIVPAKAGTHCRTNGFPLPRERRDFQQSQARNLALDTFNALRDSSLPSARLSTSHSLKTSTSLDPANRISLMALDPFGLVA